MDSSSAEEQIINQNMKKTQNRRVCDYCSESVALLYCRADSAKLCFTCDREVHSTNQLFSKHTRSLLCDVCDDSPASIYCSTECSVLCQTCDWENHRLSNSLVHDRRPLEGFNRCPSVLDFSAIFGFDDLGKKSALFFSDGDDGGGGGAGGGGGEGFDGLSDLLVWDTPGVVSLDDLITFTDSSHNFQAMEVPLLPKNRNAVCGHHKEEIYAQLSKLSELEPNFSFENSDSVPVRLLPEKILQTEEPHFTFSDQIDNPITFLPYEASNCNCCDDNGEPSSKDFLVDPPLRGSSYLEEGNSIVPIKQLDTQCLVKSEALYAPPRASPHELCTQDRETALSRYKEKKKTRRYDKHIRYESRKVRAESRMRVKGRFAKKDRNRS